MTYSIKGLEPAAFAFLIGANEELLASHHAVRMMVTETPGFPCRITLDDAQLGESMLLVNHVSHRGDNPYRASHAIFVGENAREAAVFVDVVPPALDRRILSLRAFDANGMMTDAKLVQPGKADLAIRAMLADPEVDHVDAHNATRGCFAARVERD